MLRFIVRRGAGVVSAVAVLGLLTAPAGAQTASLTLDPSTIAVGGRLIVTGTCEPNSSGFVLSQAFLGQTEFAGVPAVAFSTDSKGAFGVTFLITPAVKPGTYRVSARCGGGNLGLTRMLKVVSDGTLAATGSSDRPLLLPAAGLLVGGAALVLIGRRRATS